MNSGHSRLLKVNPSAENILQLQFTKSIFQAWWSRRFSQEFEIRCCLQLQSKPIYGGTFISQVLFSLLFILIFQARVRVGVPVVEWDEWFSYFVVVDISWKYNAIRAPSWQLMSLVTVDKKNKWSLVDRWYLIWVSSLTLTAFKRRRFREEKRDLPNLPPRLCS